VEEASQRALEFDTSVPNIARMYDYAGAGVTQFLDIGSGLPTNQDVHETCIASTRTPAWCTQTTIRWWWRTPGRYCPTPTAAVRGDVCRPDDILGTPEVGRLIDFSQPVAVLLLAGDWTLVEPGLTDIWAWRSEDDRVANTNGFMRILGGVARKG
jgi:hypothetical protein